MSESSAQRHQRRVIDAHVSHSKLAKARTVMLMVLLSRPGLQIHPVSGRMTCLRRVLKAEAPFQRMLCLV